MDLFSEYSSVYLLVLGLSCSMQTLLQHVGSSSLTRDGTWDPSIANSVPPWVSSPVLLPGKFHGWGSLVGYIQFMGLQSRTWLGDFSFFLSIVPFGEGNGNPLQCSCLENPIDRGAWWAAVYGAAKSRTRLSNYQTDRQTDRHTHTHTHTHTSLEVWKRLQFQIWPAGGSTSPVVGSWRRRAQHCRRILVWFLRSERSDEQKLRGQASTCVFRSLPCWPKRQWYTSSWAHSTCHTRHTVWGRLSAAELWASFHLDKLGFPTWHPFPELSTHLEAMPLGKVTLVVFAYSADRIGWTYLQHASRITDTIQRDPSQSDYS